MQLKHFKQKDVLAACVVMCLAASPHFAAFLLNVAHVLTHHPVVCYPACLKLQRAEATAAGLPVEDLFSFCFQVFVTKCLQLNLKKVKNNNNKTLLEVFIWFM